MANQPSASDACHLGLIHWVGCVIGTEVQILRPPQRAVAMVTPSSCSNYGEETLVTLVGENAADDIARWLPYHFLMGSIASHCHHSVLRKRQVALS